MTSPIDKVKDSSYNLCWARGDNDAKTFTIKDSTGAIIDISTWALSMAVNTDRDPADTTNEIFNVAGVFVTDGTDGQVSFTPPANSLDNIVAPGRAYYDINRVSPTKKTLLKGTVDFVMDVDKG